MIEMKKWSPEERQTYLDTLVVLGYEQNDIAEMFGYMKLPYFQRAKSYYQKTRILMDIVERTVRAKKGVMACVTIQRTYKEPSFQHANIETIHFRAPILESEKFSPDEIAAAARAQHRQKGTYAFISYNEMSLKAIKDIEVLQLSTEL